MPFSITVTQGRSETTYPVSPGSLPIELYFKIPFEEADGASTWCGQVVTTLSRVKVDSSDIGLHRIVVWGPSPPEGSWSGGGGLNAYVSELALRLLRAFGDTRVPGAIPVSLSQLDLGLHMYVGGDADQRVYRIIKPN